MAKKQLKVNMIFGGAWYSYDTVLEEEEIPLNLRKAKYIMEPRDEEEPEDEILFDADEGLEEEPKPRRIIPKKKFR